MEGEGEAQAREPRGWTPTACVFGEGYRTTINGGTPVLLAPFVDDEGRGERTGYSLMIDRACAARISAGTAERLFELAEPVLRRHERAVAFESGGPWS